MLSLLQPEHYDLILDDPVRPHIPAEWRMQEGREVYALYEDQYAEFDEPDTKPQAIICVAYTDSVPLDESELEPAGSSIAVFYTVWSYARGAGRQIVFDVAEHIKQTRDCERYVTLSPLTEMAERFHISNGASLIRKGDTCQNFEYTV